MRLQAGRKRPGEERMRSPPLLQLATAQVLSPWPWSKILDHRPPLAQNRIAMTGRPWTEEEIRLPGTHPDYEVGRMIGRPGKAVWAKRQALGIAAPPILVRHWTEAEDQ